MAGTPRFLTLSEVAETLNTSTSQVYALVRRGELTAIKMGGRGQWRVETNRLEDYIAQLYVEPRNSWSSTPSPKPRTPS